MQKVLHNQCKAHIVVDSRIGKIRGRNDYENKKNNLDYCYLLFINYNT